MQGARRAGLSLDTEIDCPAEGLGANTSLTVYRVAQEALSNVARHAPGARTRIEVRRGPAHVQVLVRNGPATGAAGARLPGPAHGLTGMRERVASAGRHRHRRADRRRRLRGAGRPARTPTAARRRRRSRTASAG